MRAQHEARVHEREAGAVLGADAPHVRQPAHEAVRERGEQLVALAARRAYRALRVAVERELQLVQLRLLALQVQRRHAAGKRVRGVRGGEEGGVRGRRERGQEREDVLFEEAGLCGRGERVEQLGKPPSGR
jgi:hypothetical protein